MHFLFRYPARSGGSRFFVAEAHQEQASARLDDAGQTDDVARAVFIGKNVKEAAVDDAVEALVPVREFQGVLYKERNRQTSLVRLALGSADRFFDKIDARLTASINELALAA